LGELNLESKKYYPEVGQLVRVRNRPAIVRNVFTTKADDLVLEAVQEQKHLVEVEYIDGWNYPSEDKIIWEYEVNPKVLSEVELPDIRLDKGIDNPETYHVYLNAIRWTNTEGIILTRGNGKKALIYRLTSPWYSSIQVEDYQLYPVLKALIMPRVRLLLADDVGLGKTIEAGLITTELINKRRIRRTLIICPASLQIQWQEEMREKFNLQFEIVDKSYIFKIQKNLGMDVNPWLTSPRIITSMDFIRQRDVLINFNVATDRIRLRGGPTLPWDLLIVDEAHNFFPSIHGREHDSQRTNMLREISQHFEHRLFLTATPHNGYTQSFTGLLEILDPLRFTQTNIIGDKDEKYINQIMIRRLKSELNASKVLKRFADRKVKELDIKRLYEEEKALFSALKAYKDAGKKVLKKQPRKEQFLGQFFYSLLIKRLLSSTYAFAKTWWSHVKGFELVDFGYDEAEQSKKLVEEPTLEDREKNTREIDAIRHFGGWFKEYYLKLKPQIEVVSEVLRILGWSEDIIEKSFSEMSSYQKDSKFEKLLNWIEDNLKENEKFKSNERVIIFTEYKDTQDYLNWRLNQRGIRSPELQLLFGGAPASLRKEVKEDFNDPQSPLRILLATDVASEGLNLQMGCRYIIHYEIPWNPMKMEQRNGRIDRHGQARDVVVFHFTSKQETDLEFLNRIVKKVNTIREDLGSVSQVFSDAITNYFIEEDTAKYEEISETVDIVTSEAIDKDDISTCDRGKEELYHEAYQKYLLLRDELNISPQNIASLLKHSFKRDNGSLNCYDGYCRIEKVPGRWEGVINKHLKIKKGRLANSLPKLVFDPEYEEFITKTQGNRKIFRITPDARLIRLGHPLVQRALAEYKKALWDPSSEINRWTISKINAPGTFDLLMVLTVLVVVRNALGEVADSQTNILPFILEKNEIYPLDEKFWQRISANPRKKLSESEINEWKRIIISIWRNNRLKVEKELAKIEDEKEKYYRQLFEQSKEIQLEREKEIYIERKEEITQEIIRERQLKESQLKRIEEKRKRINQAIKKLKIARLDEFFPLFDVEKIKDEKKEQISFLEQEKKELAEQEESLWQLSKSTRKLLLSQLEEEYERITSKIIPLRYSLNMITVFPVGIEFIIKE